jgi:hypothetical protein
LDSLFRLLQIIAIAFLAFIGGGFVVLTKAFPYEYLHNAHEAIVALYKQTEYNSPFRTNLWRPARTDQRGVTINKSGETYAGYTFYSSSHAQKAMLIAMDGTMVHEWRLPIQQVWNNPKRKLRPAGYIFWEFPYLFPNGDVIALVVGMGDTPWGYGLIKMNKDSEVIWTYFDHVHHHLDIADDGKIYVLTNDIRTHKIPNYPNLTPPRIDDYVTVLSPDGKLLKKVSILDAMLRSPYGRMLHTTAWDIKQDFLHTNSVEVIDRKAASRLPFAEEGQVLLSLRDIDTVALLDLDKEQIVWALRGPWHRQHDADMLPNGNILLFDNWGHYGPGGPTRVIEFKPSPLNIVWNYRGTEKHPLVSAIRSGQQRLPNGNTLITESDGGRLLEVTRGGKVVWEYINPIRGGGNNKLIPVIALGVQRMRSDALDTAFLESIDQSKLGAQASVGNKFKEAWESIRENP